MLKRIALVAGLAGCFPHHPIARNIALGIEGATAATGLGVALFVKPETSCTPVNFTDDISGSWCNTTDASVIGGPLVLLGLVALAITYVTSPVDEPAPKVAPPPVRALDQGSPCSADCAK